jgi:DNA-binding MarR family transcriptional regulator
METSLSLDEYYRLWLLIAQTRSAIFKARHQKVGQYLPPNQTAALTVVWAYQGQATPALIARYLFLEHHSVSELITRMKKKGLVIKSKDPKRKNIVRVSITPAGRDVCRQAMQPEFIKGIISTLSAEQRTQLQSCLQVLLREALKKLGSEMLMPIPDVP